MTVGFGIIGFLDDYIKIVMKRSEGLNPKQKLIGQIIITGIFACYLLTSKDVGTEMLIPFTGGFEDGYYLDLGCFFVPALFFIVLGTDNGVNFTDGLDGLCTSVTILVATFFTVVALGERSGISPITGAVVGSLLGFLLFNVYPARVFMGDTGSLALGRLRGVKCFYDADADFYRDRGTHLSGRGAVRNYSGGVFLRRPAENGFSGWRRSIIILSWAAGRKPRVVCRILDHNGDSLPDCLLRIIGGESMSQKVLVAGSGISGIAAQSFFWPRAAKWFYMTETQGFPRRN